MYSNTGYLNGADTEIEDTAHPLTISGCGIYRLVHQNAITTIRPSGRKDYQLLYISEGKACFHSEGKETELPAGYMALYRPGEKQHYSYYAKDNPEVCWIHFSGFESCGILDKIGFLGNHFLYCGTSSHYLEAFRRIILELQLKRPCFEELVGLYLRQLLTEVHRSQINSITCKCPHQKEMEAAVHYFNETFSQNISIEEYAKNQHMSICWFIRSFKRYMNMTPMQYITSIRINKAKELLKNSDYNIQEISNLSGYENSLYFSRIFKKYTGFSPSEYRKQPNEWANAPSS